VAGNTRELGDEGHAQPVGGQALAQCAQMALAGQVVHAMRLQKARQVGRLAVEQAAPGRQSVELASQAVFKTVCVHGSFSGFRPC
jgi:hypothetical protein